MDSWTLRAQAARERRTRLEAFGRHAAGILVRARHGLFVVDPEDASVSAALLRDGDYAPHEVEAALAHVRPDRDVLVVGAHLGAHVVPLSRRCRALVAIEANPDTAALLAANLALNRCDTVTLHNVAAGLGGERIRFLLNRENSGGAKRAPCEAAIHYVYDAPRAIEIETVSLDALLGPRAFDLVLMDIEGSEYHALTGMPGILAASRTLAVEFLPFHIRDVAGVGIDAFADAIVPFFDRLDVPGSGSVTGRAAMTAALVRMDAAGACHDLIFFHKDDAG